MAYCSVAYIYNSLHCSFLRVNFFVFAVLVCEYRFHYFQVKLNLLLSHVLHHASLQSTDELLVHLQSFDSNSIYYTIPDSSKKGVPLFYLPPNSSVPVSASLLPAS